MFILSQISGIIALILVCISYFCRNKGHFLIIQTIANLFYGTSFLLLEHYVAGIITMISIFRCIYIYIAQKYNFKYTEHCLLVFILGYIATGITFFDSYLDIIPIMTAIMFTIAFVIKNMQVVRYICIVPNALLMIYSIICTTYSNAVLDFLEVVVLVVSIIKFSLEKKSIPNSTNVIK